MLNLKPPPHNEHYEGGYSMETKTWNRVNAVDKANHIAVLLKDRQVSNVLEVGCGTGAVLAAVRAKGVGTTYVGVDVIDVDDHRADDAFDLDLRTYGGQDLPFASDQFDLVYASHVIEHLDDPRQALREMLRVARRFVFIEVPCELHARTDLRSMQRALDIGHINSYTPDSFQLLLETTGLDLESIRVFEHSFAIYACAGSKFSALIKAVVRGGLLKLAPRLATKLFCYHCGALAKVRSATQQ